MTDLTLLGIAEAGRLMARGEITAAALTESFLQRIEAVDHKIASYITVTADMARTAARQADMEMKGGRKEAKPPFRAWLDHPQRSRLVAFSRSRGRCRCPNDSCLRTGGSG